ncbi:MAG TPA: hypothetical protein VK912_10360 [Longimicrobiales bacterium]|nr:hypothetical protein [Longimicrobiales bacterium]
MERLVIPTVLTLLCAAPGLAQTVPPLTPGAEVRVNSPSVSGRYVVDGHNPETLSLRDSVGGIVHVPMATVTELSVSRGARPAGARALRGAGFGLLIGAGSGAVIGFASGDDPGGFISFTAEEKALMAGTLMGGAGAVVGAVVGLLSRGEQWAAVPLNSIRGGPSVDGGVTIGYAIRF